MFAFAGPAYLVSVGYMDPGNWATDIEGGARFGYQLLWVLLLSNAMAILLQTLSARLGIVTGRDLAQACREAYPKRISYALWILCEIAIAACDLAELLGAAIGLSLLFKLPLIAGVLLSTLDTLLVLWFNRYGIRVIESIILAFVTIIGGCFLFEVLLAKPNFHEVALGLIPRLNDQSLYVAIGILGATVMPHNLYLHSSLVQTRTIGKRDRDKRSACKYNLIDSVVALNGALLVNAAILIMAAATFFKNGVVVTEIQQAHQMLAPLLGTTVAGVVFAVALICSGQSSTITGTMAGQIVMEGFLDFRMRPWLRRFITRSAAVVPAVFTIWWTGDHGAYKLLILSQVVLSLQLPFAVIPLIRFTSDKRQMGNFHEPRLGESPCLVVRGDHYWIEPLAGLEYLAGLALVHLAAPRPGLGGLVGLGCLCPVPPRLLRPIAGGFARPAEAAGVPQYPGPPGPFPPRPCRAVSCHGAGQSPSRQSPPAARGRRCHQPGLWRPGGDGRGGERP